MKGVDQWTTASGVRVMRCLYPADPEKDPDTEVGLRWLKSYSSGFPGGINGDKWQQEMEANPGAGGGELIWPNFNLKVKPHIIFDVEDLKVPDHWPIYLGMDWGMVNPTVFTVHAVESLERIYQIDELIFTDDPSTPESRLNIKRICSELKRRYWWEQVQNITGDPSIWRRLPRPDEGTTTSVGEMFGDEGVHIQKGRNEPGVDFTYITMLNSVLWHDLEDPIFMIGSNCKKTLKCYSRIRKKPVRNAFARQDNAVPEKIVDKNVDEFDANKYIHLTMGFDEPESVEETPGTFDWYVKQIEDRAQMQLNILR
jgi:hypothetical protein